MDAFIADLGSAQVDGSKWRCRIRWRDDNVK